MWHEVKWLTNLGPLFKHRYKHRENVASKCHYAVEEHVDERVSRYLC